MKIPTVDYCCCGLSVKLGTLLIGIFALVGSMGAFANTLGGYHEVEEVIDHPDLDDPKLVKIREHLFAVQVYMYMGFLVTITGTILATVLLMGYFTSNQTWLRSWVIGTVFIQTISLSFNVFMCIIIGEYIYMIFNTSVLLNLYFACVVNSYAQEIIKGSASSIA